MKTNQDLVRKLDRFDVIQRTKDGMFNATCLMSQWNHYTGGGKEIRDYLKLNSTEEFIEELIKEENLNTENPPYLTKRGRTKGGTWMHPLLFLDFAMWLNPRFKVKVLKFVHDQLIEYRNKIGDKHKTTMLAISRFNPDARHYMAVNKGINYIVFGRHDKDIRNTATEEQMRHIHKIQDDIELLVSRNFIKNFGQLMDYLRDEWRRSTKNPF